MTVPPIHLKDVDPDVLGVIRPPDDGEGPPVFEVLGKSDRAPSSYRDPKLGPNVRPCEHNQDAFKLDDKWGTVHCGTCGVQVSAYHVVKRFAEWSEQWRRDRAMSEQAERQNNVSHLRTLFRLKSITDEERKEIDVLLRNHWGYKADKLREIVTRIDAAERERFWARKKQRNGEQG